MEDQPRMRPRPKGAGTLSISLRTANLADAGRLVHDRLVAVGEVDGDVADGHDLMIAELDRRDAADIDLALDRRRRLVRMNRGRVPAVDHVVPMHADIDVVRPGAALNEFIAVVDIDRVMAAAEDRVMTVAA